MTDRLSIAALRIAAALFLTTGLSGCIADRLEPGEAARIHTIRIIAPPEPRRYDVNVFASPSMGARIGTYDAVLSNDIMRTADAGDIDAKLTAALTEGAGLRLGAELAAELGRSLSAAGHRVARGNEPVDATLDIALLYAGYVDQPLRPLTPLIIVELTLTDSGTDAGGKRLFRQRYSYSRLPYLADDVRIVPDPHFTFADEAALLGDPAHAAEGLRAGLARIAAEFRHN